MQDDGESDDDSGDVIESVLGDRRASGVNEFFVVKFSSKSLKRAKEWVCEDDVPVALVEGYRDAKRGRDKAQELASFDKRPAALTPMPSKLQEAPSDPSRWVGDVHLEERLVQMVSRLEQSVRAEQEEEEKSRAGGGDKKKEGKFRWGSKTKGGLWFCEGSEVSRVAREGDVVVVKKKSSLADAELMGTVMVRKSGEGVWVALEEGREGGTVGSEWYLRVVGRSGEWPTYLMQKRAIGVLRERRDWGHDDVRRALLQATTAPPPSLSRKQQRDDNEGWHVPDANEAVTLSEELKCSLNDGQKEALRKCVSQRVTCIQGPPGTGKTRVAAALVRVLVEYRRKKKGGWNSPVLATCEGNAGADNLLEMIIKGSNLDVVRVTGKGSKVSEEGRKRALDWDANLDEDGKGKKETLKERNERRRKRIQSCDVVIATNVGAGNLAGMTFAVHVMDEAAVASLTSGLIPLVLGTQMLVALGDHKQLAPFSHLPEEALKQDNSLFEHLIAGPNISPHVLTLQYRMHPHILKWPNDTFYRSVVTCAPHLASLALPQGFQWPNSSSHIALIDFRGYEETRNGSIFNQKEAALCNSLVRSLQTASLKINIITFYREQVEEIRSLVSDINVEVDTVDAFQGREADIIIVSTVRCNGNVGFLNNPRRINVAFTRAKAGLIVIGHIATMEADPILKSFVEHVKRSKAVVLWASPKLVDKKK